MRLLSFALLSLFIFSSCHKNCGTNPSNGNKFIRVDAGFTEDLTDISFSGNSDGIVSGTYGFIAKTANGGSNWQVLNNPTGQSLLSAFLLNPSEIFTARNGLHYSSNGGQSFTEIATQLGTDNSIKGIKFFTSQEGFIIKGKSVYKTTDGGANWQGKYFEPGYLNRMQFLNNDVAFISGGISFDGFSKGELYKTTDGGESWVPVIPANQPQILSSFFLDKQTGFIADFGMNIFKTTDGGANWNIIYTAFPSFINDMAFTSAQTGYAATYDGKLYETTNGGNSWVVAYDAPDTSLNRIMITPGKSVWVVGNNGLVLKK
jgi:photosystem II stability/assembly factor-like uncharacterized protein